MSAVPPKRPAHPPRKSRTAEVVAEQVEKIIEAARASAEQVAAAAEAEAAQIKAQARESAQAELAAARRGVVRMGEEARQEAEERIATAQAAADEALKDARAVSAGMRQLGQLLSVHAERILRDVQNSHRAISANLRAAGGGPAGSDGIGDADLPGASEASPAPRARRPTRGTANPLEDLEPPSWVEGAR